MTDHQPEIEAALNRIEGQLSEQIRAIHALEEKSDFWHKPSVAGGRTRAQQVEDLLSALRAGGLVSRALLWVAGLIIAAGTVWSTLKGWNLK
jgi:hypothetical protein